MNLTTDGKGQSPSAPEKRFSIISKALRTARQACIVLPIANAQSEYPWQYRAAARGTTR
jgi:hypothetical protein